MGRILSRMTKDQETLDNELPGVLYNVSYHKPRDWVNLTSILVLEHHHLYLWCHRARFLHIPLSWHRVPSSDRTLLDCCAVL